MHITCIFVLYSYKFQPCLAYNTFTLYFALSQTLSSPLIPAFQSMYSLDHSILPLVTPLLLSLHISLYQPVPLMTNDGNIIPCIYNRKYSRIKTLVVYTSSRQVTLALCSCLVYYLYVPNPIHKTGDEDSSIRLLKSQHGSHWKNH